jgi:hypothetical protein
VPPEQIVQQAQGAGKMEAAAAGKTEMSEAARKMAAPAQAATAALEKQEAISKKKAAATKEATGAVKQLSEAEKGVGQDAEKATASMTKANAGAGRLLSIKEMQVDDNDRSIIELPPLHKWPMRVLRRAAPGRLVRDCHAGYAGRPQAGFAAGGRSLGGTVRRMVYPTAELFR